MRSGPFNGFVVKEKQNPDGSPRLANVGSFQLTSKADGKISAKIVTSKGTYQFSAASWDSAGDKFALKAATTNKDILEIEVDPAAAWNVMQLQGRFQPAKGEEGAIVAQLNPFATKW